jgi:hypothetical protein
MLIFRINFNFITLNSNYNALLIYINYFNFIIFLIYKFCLISILLFYLILLIYTNILIKYYTIKTNLTIISLIISSSVYFIITILIYSTY